MASTYSNLGIEKPGTGEQSGTWGITADNNYDFLDAASAGVYTWALADTNATLTMTDGVASNLRNKVIRFTGALTANRTLTISPSDLTNLWVMVNATTGGFSLIITQGAGSTTATIGNGTTAFVYCDGNNNTRSAVISVSAGTGIALSAAGAISQDVNSLTEDTVPDPAADFYLSYDTSASTHKKVKPATAVTSLTEDTTPDPANDFAVTYDTSATTLKKVKPINLLQINSLTEDTSPDKSNDFLVTYDASATTLKKVKLIRASNIGAHLVPLLSSSMITDIAAASQPASTTTKTATNGLIYKGYAFDPSAIESLYFFWPMPSSWNEGTVTFRVWWLGTSGSGDVVWDLAGVAISDGDDIDAAFGTVQSSTDTYVASKLLRSPTSSAITIAGTPATGDMVFWRLRRNATSGSDTFTQDAIAIAVELLITTDADTDS